MLAMHSCVLGLLLNLILSFLIGCHGFSGGPPWKMCSLKIPKHHGMQQQSSDSPYEITLSKTTYSLGENITVTVRGKTNADLFRGFVIGAHPVTGDTENVVGKFVQLPADSKGMSWYAEAQNDPNCVCHNGASNKKSITFIWQAPPRNYGNLKFVAAIVKNFNVFWANVTSSVLTSNSASAVPAFTASIQFSSSLASLPDSVKGCGSTYGCILYPRYCKGSGCEMVVMFSVTGGILDLKMAGRSSGYLSMATSDDSKMGNDFTITCTASNNKAQASLQNGYNPAYSNERHRVVDYSNVRLHHDNKRIYCSFQRPLNISITTVKVDSNNVGTYSFKDFDLRLRRYVFLAAGNLYNGLQAFGKHSCEPVITTSPVDFLSKNIYYASAMPLLVKIHGFCMLIGWMFLGGLGSTIAGNYKNVIVKKFRGVQLWFQLHIGIMCAAAIFTITGFILILVHGWRERAMTHGIVGCIGISFMVIQIITGLVMPDPSHPRRVVFYWVHFAIGNLVFTLLADSILLSTMIPHLPAMYRKNNMIVAIVWIVVLVIWMGVFMVLKILAKKREREVAQVSEKNDEDKNGEPQGDDGDEGTKKESVPSQFGVEERTDKNEEDQKRNRMMLSLLGWYIVSMLIFLAVFASYVAIY